MVVRGWKRGHRIIYDFVTRIWKYEDNGEPASVQRTCIRCNKLPTVEGHDACLGTIPDVEYACCGHGVIKPYQWKKK